MSDKQQGRRFRALRHKPYQDIWCRLGRHEWRHLGFEYGSAHTLVQCRKCWLVQKIYLEDTRPVSVGFFPFIPDQVIEGPIELVHVFESMESRFGKETKG